MEEKIKDIRNAIDNGCFLSALSLALTLPDICGKVEFPQKVRKEDNGAGKEVYIDWFNKYVSPYYPISPKYVNEYISIQFDGKACYSLRCAYLHSGNIDIESKKMCVEINQFDLCLSSAKDNGAYVDNYGVITYNDSAATVHKVRLDVRKLCKVLSDVAEKYYKEHDSKLFKNYETCIINIEECNI